jgi:hypothetical protein
MSDKDWNSDESYFRFTRGTFVRNEAEQLSSRCVRFDMNELTRVAARSLGATACVAVSKLPEGMYNKTFLMSMDDGQQCIAKIPNPNAGIPHFNTASEVATMTFVSQENSVKEAVSINLQYSRLARSLIHQRQKCLPTIVKPQTQLVQNTLSWRKSPVSNLLTCGHK